LQAVTVDRSKLEQEIFALGDHVRYVAFGFGQDVHTAQQGNVDKPSDLSSDFFEELLVNPTLLTIASQRGNLDCGGLSYIVVGYGNFTQVVVPAAEGHVSVCVQRGSDAQLMARQIIDLLDTHTS
jgi:hypothetical protein